MPQYFQRHHARKALRSPKRVATIEGRPAWQVVEERRREAEKKKDT